MERNSAPRGLGSAHYRFGNRHQTVSAIFGKNKRAKTLFGLDKDIADTLNAIEPNHVEKAADLDIIKE